ncbi:MAG: hypothetical protein WC758_04080 [Candidatus Woesearchaeota archaeon]|jgi:hypothetical protein
MTIKKTKVVKLQKKVNDDYAVASLILGISSIVLPVIGIVTGILAILFANKQRKIESNSMATAGLITGIIGLVFQAIMLLVLIALFSFIGIIMTSAVGSTV